MDVEPAAVDGQVGLPLRYALGFMLGGDPIGVFGPDTARAFGHIGFMNILCWADPERQLTAALMTSGKPLLYPEIYYMCDIPRRIGAACPKTAPRPRPRRLPRARRGPARVRSRVP